MHHFLEAKRDLLDRLSSPNPTRTRTVPLANGTGKAQQDQHHEADAEAEADVDEDEEKTAPNRRERTGFSLNDIEIEDEFCMNVTTALELRQVIAQCPSRTVAFSWKLFYSTA